MKSPLAHLIVACSFCIAAFALYGIWYSYIADTSKEVAALQNEIDSKTETAGRLATARTTLSEITTDETQIQNYFVSQTAVVGFIDSLENRGRALGSTINVLSVSTGGTVSQPTLIFILSIEGTFDAVARTVGAIEYAPYALTVSKLAFAHDEKKGWHADLNLVAGSVVSNPAP